MITKRAFKKSREWETFIIELEDVKTKAIQKMEVNGTYSLMRMRAFQLMGPGVTIKDIYRKNNSIT